MKSTTIARIACLLVASANCKASGNVEWEHRHEESLMDIVKNHLPSGSGIDSGTSLLRHECKPDRIVLGCGYHHMNEGGMYDGWTQHKIIITPAFDGIHIRVTGPNRNDIKDYLAAVYFDDLSAEIEH
jgi:hypothetical protein